MNLLMTADTVGGVWTYALDLAGSLEPHGVKTTLATMGAPLSPAQREAADSIQTLTLFESRYALEWTPDPWDDVTRAGAWLLDLEARVKPDLIHLNGYAHGALPWSAPVLVVGHSCVLSWWEAVKGEAAPPEWTRYQSEVTRGLHAADLVVAPTAAMLRALERHYGPLSRTCVIPNGRDAAVWPPAPKEPFILSAGRLWDEAKNVAVLAEAAPRISWPIYLAGDSKHPNGGEARLEHVHLLGTLPPQDLARWLGRASIYALPARYEPFGLSALEAALAGCALLLGDIPSLREVWGEAALFVPPDDVEAWAEALNGLIENPLQRETLAARGRSRALELTPARMAEAYMQVYQSLMSTKGAEEVPI